MAKQLNVSGAFHSPLMEPARERLAAALAEAPIQDAEFPVYVNVSAAPVTTAADIRDSLLQQLTAPVQWTRTIERMVADGATELIEVGPGNVLQGLAKRIATGVEIRGIDSPEKVEELNAQV
jgi:[acyl-carrier-protein] S-malonyltransferase